MTGNQYLVVRVDPSGGFYVAYIVDGPAPRTPANALQISRTATASTLGTAVANELSGAISGST